jgi:hypothetical protein
VIVSEPDLTAVPDAELQSRYTAAVTEARAIADELLRRAGGNTDPSTAD